jgi:Domain of unknown function (DUF4396)
MSIPNQQAPSRTSKSARPLPLPAVLTARSRDRRAIPLAISLGWRDIASIALAVVLAFVFGYSLTLGPVVRAGVPRPAGALSLAFPSDTASIGVMEAVDSG